MDSQLSHYIGGKQYPDTHSKVLPVYNPATGQCIAEVPIASEMICAHAVAVARKAFQDWSSTTPVKRANILFRFRELLEKYSMDLAKLVTREHGKTLEDAKGSIARAIELVELHCGLITQLQGTYSTNVSTNIDCYTLKQPIGVCAGVSPFNFPVMVPIWMMIPAIACGNTFILKPSEQDPSAPVRLLELLSEAGLPDGVANCVHGDKTTVEHLLANPGIDSFTAVASTPVAESIYKTAIANGKRAHTFGGAKNHCVVMPDADLEQAASAITGAAFGSAGERCMAVSVVVAVGDETADALRARLVPKIQAIRIHPGDEPEADMGPLVSHIHRERVIKAIEDGIEEGAEVVLDGRNFRHARFPDGFFLGATFFDRVKESMSVYQNEIFGPVLVMLRVADFESALDLVNRHQFGNGTAIFTQDGYIAHTYVNRVQAGMVGINIPIPVPVASHPFGGWKRSCFGDTGMHGLESVHMYTKLKTITSKWFHASGTNAFVMPTNR